MPLAFLKAMFKPQFVWNYTREPEPHLNGRQPWPPRGRRLSGSCNIVVRTLPTLRQPRLSD